MEKQEGKGGNSTCFLWTYEPPAANHPKGWGLLIANLPFDFLPLAFEFGHVTGLDQWDASGGDGAEGLKSMCAMSLPSCPLPPPGQEHAQASPLAQEEDGGSWSLT